MEEKRKYEYRNGTKEETRKWKKNKNRKQKMKN
jgi:hypothetical protein